MISPHDLATLLADQLHGTGSDLSETPFHDLVIDSRKVEPGDLFVALRGEQTDGHTYIPDAIARGARSLLVRTALPNLPTGVTAFVVDDPLSALQAAAKQWRQSLDVHIVGITGSVGKTTTREVIAQVLARKYQTLESPRNFNSNVGLPLTLLGLGPEHRWCVMEMGPYDLAEMQLLCDVGAPDIGVVTNVGPTHLERFGSLEAIEEAKGTLPAALPADGVAVLNGDEPRIRHMAARTEAQVLYYGQGREVNVRASDLESHGLDGIVFTLHMDGVATPVQTALVGAHHIMTALAAAAVASAVGYRPSEIAAALADLHAGVRLRTRRAYSGALILDDTYNAAPLSMRAALDLLAEMPGRRIAVLGDMLELGDQEEAGHREVGAYSVDRCDRLLAIGPRARTIADGAWDAGHKEIQWFETKENATAVLRNEVGADDVVLVKASHGLALETVVEALVDPQPDGGRRAEPVSGGTA